MLVGVLCEVVSTASPLEECNCNRNKRKRNTNECDRPTDHEDDSLDSKSYLKRKRNPDDLIDLGNIDHDNLNLNFLRPALKPRFYGNVCMRLLACV